MVHGFTKHGDFYFMGITISYKIGHPRNEQILTTFTPTNLFGMFQIKAMDYTISRYLGLKGLIS